MSDLRDVDVLVLDVLGTMVDEPSGIRAAIREAWPQGGDQGVDELVEEWQRHVEREQERIARGERAYVNTEVIDAEAARRVARRIGLTEPAAIATLGAAGQRLPAWGDSAAGLERLAATRPVIGLSNASRTALLRLNAYAGLRWHLALSGELASAYKPDPQVYRLAVDAAGCSPDRMLMVAAHAWDLRGAAAVGMRTAYVGRPVGDPPTGSDAFDASFGGLDGLVAALTAT